MQSFSEVVKPFMSEVKSGRVELYNEFSFQHELGIFLRASFPGLKVQFERNVSHFFPSKREFTKREIDISVASSSKADKTFALELKFPRNGQVPEQMFSFCKDIAFVEELVAAGFQRAAFMVLADDHLFYSGPAEGIYGYFRGGRLVHGKIQKPTGKKDDFVEIRGHVQVQTAERQSSVSHIAELPAFDRYPAAPK